MKTFLPLDIIKVIAMYTSWHWMSLHNTEILHCDRKSTLLWRFNVWRHPMAGKSILLSLLYYVKTSNGRKVYIAHLCTLCEGVMSCEFLQSSIWHSNMLLVYLTIKLQETNRKEKNYNYYIVFVAEHIKVLSFILSKLNSEALFWFLLKFI